VPSSALARELATDKERGLTEEEAASRLAAHGPNRLPRPDRPAYLAIVGRQLADPLIALLVVAAAVSAAIGEGIEAAAIAAIVVVNGVIGFVQEVGAERAVLSLRARLRRRANVVRTGQEREVFVEDVVPGDLLVLREGDRVSADARLVRAEGLEVDESILTGESLPVSKAVEIRPADTPLAERSGMAYAGTGVTRGRARALVTATAGETEMGRIASLAAGAKPPPTPLQERLAGLARAMVVLGVGVTLALGAGMLARGSSLDEAFLVGVSVAVAAVPEGLAATVTIALALGAREMAARGAIVRRLPAVETLGSATVVASDKTGTLTENRLRLAAAAPALGRSEVELVGAGVLASTAELIEDRDGVRIAGDPVEGALLLAARERGLSREALLEGLELEHEVPFEPERKRMTLVYDDGSARRAVVKGAPEAILGRSLVSAEEHERLERLAAAWAAEGLRVLAVAERFLDGHLDLEDDELERDLVPLGLVALHDPLRETAAGAVREARAAGLGVQILTGDHPATAKAIARALDVPDESVYARVTPAEKLRLVEELQEAGEVVAVTGDGVNDSPALRRADVGVAMGRSGTEAAREASDIVLTDDDFSTIVAAIREGRRIADNLRKFVAFLLSANLGEVFLFAVSVLAGLGAPMTVVQVLAVNMMTDGLPAVALSRDAASAESMSRLPRRGTRIFPPRLWAALAAVGALVGLAALAAYLLGRTLGGGAAQTMAFATVAFSELVLVFSCRSLLAPAWRIPRNPFLLLGVAVSAAFVVLIVYLPALHAPFGTVALGAPKLAVVAALALAPALVVELAKAVARRRAA
jgi:calcium-translocating P-type ATPase